MRRFSGLLACLIGYLTVSGHALGLFHGTSIIVYPNTTSLWPGNSTFVAANFYCYYTPLGYLSFGWWLPATPGADHSQCRPNPSSYDWFEYTTSADCTTASCRFHAFNYMTANVSTPYFEEIYLHSALDLGNGRLGQLGLGYFDKPGGAYAVGTIRTLDDDSGSLQMVNDCHDAFHTLETIREKYDLTLSFELKNNCPPKGGERNQLGASSYWQKVLGSFQRSNGDLK